MANVSQHPAVIAYREYIKTLSGAAWTEARRKVVELVAETLPQVAESKQRFVTLVKENHLFTEYGVGAYDVAREDGENWVIVYPRRMDTQELKAALDDAGFVVDWHVDYSPSDWLRVWVE